MIKTILFDVDGVMLSEERYFDASALTVWEFLCNEKTECSNNVNVHICCFVGCCFWRLLWC